MNIKKVTIKDLGLEEKIINVFGSLASKLSVEDVNKFVGYNVVSVGEQVTTHHLQVIINKLIDNYYKKYNIKIMIDNIKSKICGKNEIKWADTYCQYCWENYCSDECHKTFQTLEYIDNSDNIKKTGMFRNNQIILDKNFNISEDELLGFLSIKCLKGERFVYFLKNTLNEAINVNRILNIYIDTPTQNHIKSETGKHLYFIKFKTLDGFFYWVYKHEVDRDNCFKRLQEKISFENILD